MCFCCNKKFNKIFLKECEYCNEMYCISHTAPDSHQCENNEQFITHKKEEFVVKQQQLILEKNKIEQI